MARFDLQGSAQPMPSDLLRDAAAARLAMPIDHATTDAERELYGFLNTLDGWSSAVPATVQFTSAIDPASLDSETVQVWQWGDPAVRIEDVILTLDATGTRLTITPPRTGWKRSASYVAMVRGGAGGIAGRRGEIVEPDTTLRQVRQEQPLADPQLEAIRQHLAPCFQHFEQAGIARDDVAALWRFTITSRVELAMDQAMHRSPLPFDLFIDPATSKVDLPKAPWDTPSQAYAKRRIAEYDGFGTSIDLLFELTGPVDPASVNAETVTLWNLSGPAPRQLGALIRVLDDRAHVVMRPSVSSLPEQTRFAVVVSDGVRDRDGQPIVAMPIGHFLRSPTPVAENGKSQVPLLGDAEAVRIEGVRGELTGLLDKLGRDRVVAAWPFTTMSIRSHLIDLAGRAEALALPVQPRITRTMTPAEAAQEFPLVLPFTLDHVGTIYEGEIQVPFYLDPITRGWRSDGGYEVQPIPFTMAIPRAVSPETPLKVVMFVHHVMTERRTLLTIADELNRRGFAVIGMDLPYHGPRTSCVWNGPLCYPDPISEKEICPNPCELGSTCTPDGRCIDSNGNGNHLAQWPLLGFPQASGAAFFDVSKISDIRDRIAQSIVELGALSRALRTADWTPLIGHAVDRTHLSYVGQSIGSVIGATYVSIAPEIRRAVFNVPGADTVDLFTNSPIFGPHVRLFMQQEGIERGSYDEERFLNIARWLMDPVDPLHQAAHIGKDRGMIQMATLDFIIPNPYSKVLQELSGMPRRDYLAEHAFEIVSVEPEYARGVCELAGFLEGTFSP